MNKKAFLQSLPVAFGVFLGNGIFWAMLFDKPILEGFYFGFIAIVLVIIAYQIRHYCF